MYNMVSKLVIQPAVKNHLKDFDRFIQLEHVEVTSALQ
jgi:hypothetical protein